MRGLDSNGDSAPTRQPRMQPAPDVLVLAQGGIQELRDMQRVLARAGIDSELVRPPKEKCSS